MYCEVTNSIEVTVSARYCYERSSEDDGVYFWTYDVNIRNLSDKTIKLEKRNWVIIDEKGQVRNISGEGVIGKSPVLYPGERFAYNSNANLHMGTGLMFGSYEMKDINNEECFSVKIPAFSLDVPDKKVLFN